MGITDLRMIYCTNWDKYLQCITPSVLANEPLHLIKAVVVLLIFYKVLLLIMLTRAGYMGYHFETLLLHVCFYQSGSPCDLLTLPSHIERLRMSNVNVNINDYANAAYVLFDIRHMTVLGSSVPVESLFYTYVPFYPKLLF
jgi:hypothetical protein